MVSIQLKKPLIKRIWTTPFYSTIKLQPHLVSSAASKILNYAYFREEKYKLTYKAVKPNPIKEDKIMTNYLKSTIDQK